MKAVEAKNLSKNFGKDFLLSDVNFYVNEGEFLALVGNNGAGKTTLLSLISGLLLPSKGEIFILGNNINKLKHITNWLGVVHQYTGLPELLTVNEFLKFEARMRNLNQEVVEEALELSNLRSYINTKICDLSEGSKRKAVIVKALLHRPRVLLLDEPTVGLDPLIRNEIWNYLFSLKKKGISAIISTNYLDEAEQLCDRAMFIFDGMIVAEGTIEELKNYNIKDHLLIVSLRDKEKSKLDAIADYLRNKEDGIFRDIIVTKDGLKILCNKESSLVLPLVVTYLTEKGIHISAVTTGEKTLESTMLYLSSKNS